jgi:hypothetical protein
MLLLVGGALVDEKFGQDQSTQAVSVLVNAKISRPPNISLIISLYQLDMMLLRVFKVEI